MKKYTHCEYCGKELNKNEHRMGAASHFDCWHKVVVKDRENIRGGGLAI